MIRLPCFTPLRDGDRFFGCVRASCFAHLWTMFAVAYARACGRSASVPN